MAKPAMPPMILPQYPIATLPLPVRGRGAPPGARPGGQGEAAVTADYPPSSDLSCTVVSCPTTGSAIAASRLLAPFHCSGGRTCAVRADLVDAPVDFQVVAVRVLELDRELHAGAAAALEMDPHVVLAQVVARPQHLVQRGDLERDVVQAGAVAVVLGGLEQRDAVVVGVQPHEHRAAGQRRRPPHRCRRSGSRAPRCRTSPSAAGPARTARGGRSCSAGTACPSGGAWRRLRLGSWRGPPSHR